MIKTTVQTEWRTIEGFSKYEINEIGEVRHVRTGNLINIHRDSHRNINSRHFKMVSDEGEWTCVSLRTILRNTFSNHGNSKTVAQRIEGMRFDKERFDSISLEEFKTEAVIIASNVVAQRAAKLNMYEMDDLKGYLTEKALMIVEKFDPTSTKNGWKDLGSFLFFTLSNHAKNFNQQYFNYLKGIAPMTVKGEEDNDSVGFHHEGINNGAEDTAYEDVEFFADNILGELLELLTPRQKFILKGRLDLKNNVEIASELGTTKMTVGRDLKKIQEIATIIGIAI